MQANPQVDLLQKRHDTMQLICVSMVIIGLSFLVSSLVPYAVVFVLGVMCGRTGFSIFVSYTAQGASKLIRQITGAQPLPTVVANPTLQDSTLLGSSLPIAASTTEANLIRSSSRRRSRRRAHDSSDSEDDEEEAVDTRNLERRRGGRRNNTMQVASFAAPFVRGFGQMVIDEWTKGS